MTKRWLSVLLAVMLTMYLCACGKDSHRNKENTTTVATTTTTAATSAATTTTTTTTTATTTATTTTTSTTRPISQNDVVNIALFGIDQTEGTVGRCDTTIILSLDYTNKAIKLTSIARDSLVPIPGHGEEKLTHAWAYGGAALALDTLNGAFGTDLADYVYVNLSDFATIIDLIGGVEITVNEVELAAINYTPNEAEKLPGTGTYRLNGAQALRYVRCRTDSDANRTARQRTLLKAILEEARSLSTAERTKLLFSLRHVYHTNLSDATIVKILSWVVLQKPMWEELSLPNDQLNPWGGILDAARGWVYVYDLEYAAALLQDFIYGTDTAADLPQPTNPQF